MKNSLPMAIIIAGILIAGAVIYQGSPKDTGVAPTQQNNNLAKNQILPIDIPVSDSDHILGNMEAPITIVEYSDYQCPFCSSFHPTMQKAMQEYAGQVRWVYKHFPLDQIHPHARPSAEASECVAEQGGNDAFWQFTDAMFESQTRLGPAFYTETAEELGLNMEQFQECVSSRKYKDKVEDDYQEGIQAGVRGTPGSFINGETVPGAVPYETLKSMIDKAIANL